MNIIAHKLKRFIKWSIISSVILVITFFILISAFFPVQRVVNFAVESASTALGRRIAIGSVSFNVFKGISLRKIEVANEKGFSRRPLLKAKELWLAYDLRALVFERRILISTVDIDGLEFVYEKNLKGDNCASMLERLTAVPSGNSQAKDKTAAVPKKKKKGIALRVYTVKLRNSSVDYVDSTPGNKRSIKVSAVNLTLWDLSHDLRNLPVTAKGSFRLSLGGTSSRIGFSAKEQGLKRFSLHVAVDSLQMDKVLSAFKATSPQKLSTKKNKKGVKKPLYSDLRSLLKGYTVDCSGTVSRFAWRKAVVEALHFKAVLRDLQLRLTTDALGYGGKANGVMTVQLSRPQLPYVLDAQVSGVSGGQLLRDATTFGDSADGTLQARVLLNGNVTSFQKVNGSVDATFRNGTMHDSSVLLPGFPAYICEQLNGKMFDLFFVKLLVRKGKPAVGALKIQGNGIDIDQTVNLDMDVLKKQVRRDILVEKKRVQREFNTELAKKKKELDRSVDAEKQKTQDALDVKKEEALNDLMEQLKKKSEK